MSSGRDARSGGGRDGGEGLKDAEVPAGIEPGGDEAVRADENTLDAVTIDPLGEGPVIATERKCACAARWATETDKAGAERLEDDAVARRNHHRGINPNAEDKPLMATEKAIERRSAPPR